MRRGQSIADRAIADRAIADRAIADRAIAERASSSEGARSRVFALALTGLIHAAFLWLLIVGLAGPFPKPTRDVRPSLVSLTPLRRADPPLAATAHDSGGRSKAGSPSAIIRPVKAAPTIAAPQPVPIASPQPATTQPASGTASIPGGMATGGNGSGIAGAGTGEGSGGTGSGTGTGEGAGDGGSDPEWRSGRIRDRDYPEAARRAGHSGTTRTEVTVGRDGRPIVCVIRRSSGDAQLDQATCRLIMDRFRFRPARDAAGRPVIDSVYYDQEWQAPSPQPEE